MLDNGVLAVGSGTVPMSHPCWLPQCRCSLHQSANPCAVHKTTSRHVEAVFLRFCSPQTSLAAQRAGDLRRVAREDEGRPGHPQGAGDGWSAPEEGTCPGERCRTPRTHGLGSRAWRYLPAQPLRRLPTSRLALSRWIAPSRIAVSVIRVSFVRDRGREFQTTTQRVQKIARDDPGLRAAFDMRHPDFSCSEGWCPSRSTPGTCRG